MQMRREDRKMSAEESLGKLSAATYGVLSLVDNGIPYAIPLNHYYEENTLYFHAAIEGRKLNIISANPAACYVVAECSGFRTDAVQALCEVGAFYHSVICSGSVRIIRDPASKATIVTKLTRHLCSEALAHLADVPEESTSGIVIIALDIDEISGKACRLTP